MVPGGWKKNKKISSNQENLGQPNFGDVHGCARQALPKDFQLEMEDKYRNLEHIDHGVVGSL